MSAPLVVRPDAGPGYSPSAPFFQHAAMTIADGHLDVVGEAGDHHRFRLGDGPGEAARLAIVYNFSIATGAPEAAFSARSWLLVVDSTNTALVATDLDVWDETEVHTWWCRVHGGSLDSYVVDPARSQEHLPRTERDGTVLLLPTRRTGAWAAGAAYTIAGLLLFVPQVTDVPFWVGAVPIFLVIAALVVLGEIRGRRADRERAARLHELEARIPPERRSSGG